MVSIRSLFGHCNLPLTIYHLPFSIDHLAFVFTVRGAAAAAAAHLELISNTAAVTFDTLCNGFVRSGDGFSIGFPSNRNRKL